MRKQLLLVFLFGLIATLPYSYSVNHPARRTFPAHGISLFYSCKTEVMATRPCL